MKCGCILLEKISRPHDRLLKEVHRSSQVRATQVRCEADFSLGSNANERNALAPTKTTLRNVDMNIRRQISKAYRSKMCKLGIIPRPCRHVVMG